jgi:hypothetical protein
MNEKRRMINSNGPKAFPASHVHRGQREGPQRERQGLFRNDDEALSAGRLSIIFGALPA